MNGQPENLLNSKTSIREGQLLASKDLYNAFVEGVSRFPQGFFGISIFLCHVFLNEDGGNFEQLSHVHFSAEQESKLVQQAAVHHEKKKVNLPPEQAANASVTRPLRSGVHHIWEVGKGAAMDRQILVRGVLLDYDSALLRERQSTSQEPPRAREKLKEVFAAYVGALRTQEGVKISEDYIEKIKEMNKTNNRHPLSAAVAEIENRVHVLFVSKLAVVFPEEKYPGLASKLGVISLPNDWSQPGE